jgi:hypothetical protein
MGAMKSDGGLHSAFDVLIARFGKKTQSGFPKKTQVRGNPKPEYRNAKQIRIAKSLNIRVQPQWGSIIMHSMGCSFVSFGFV